MEKEKISETWIEWRHGQKYKKEYTIFFSLLVGLFLILLMLELIFNYQIPRFLGRYTIIYIPFLIALLYLAIAILYKRNKKQEE